MKPSEIRAGSKYKGDGKRVCEVLEFNDDEQLGKLVLVRDVAPPSTEGVECRVGLNFFARWAREEVK